MAGIGTMIGWIFDRLPSRGESMRNEIDKLTAERKRLLEGVCNDKTASRVLAIDIRIDKLNSVLKNKA